MLLVSDFHLPDDGIELVVDRVEPGLHVRIKRVETAVESIEERVNAPLEARHPSIESALRCVKTAMEVFSRERLTRLFIRLWRTTAMMPTRIIASSKCEDDADDQPIAQTFGAGITQTNCTADAATKQCGSLPAMKTVSPAANGRSPCSDFTTPLPLTMKTSCSQG